MEIPIIYEDELMLVVNKPTGLMVHGDGRSSESTLSEWVLETYPEIKNVGELWVNQKEQAIPRPGIVHRLDKDTSGVMVIAKTSESFEFLKKQFQDREVQKIYHAFVYGNIKEDEGVIDKQIGKSKKDFRQFSAQPGARGTKRDAVTAFRILARTENKEACYVEMSPKTGRTHQLRVHMKAIHHPIVCDSLYASNRESLLDFKRLALHSYIITITTQNKEKMTFTAPLPKDFLMAIKHCVLEKE